MPNGKIRLSKLDMKTADLESRADYERRLGKLQTRLLHIQQTYWHEKRRAVLVFEPRSYLFRGIDHDPYHLNEGSLVLREISRAPSAGALAAAWHARGVRWVVVRTGSHDVFHPSFVAGYTPAQWRRDKARVDELLARHAEVVAEDPPYVLARLAPGR